MKLNPNLEDWWTKNCVTEITIGNNNISGAGISLKVVLQMLINKELTFYSYLGGQYQDNLHILGTKENCLLNFEKSQYINEQSPVREWYGEELNIQEFKILDPKLNEDTEEEYFEYYENRKDLFYLKMHDNFIVYLTPYSDDSLNSLIKNICYLHSYYLNYDIPTDEFLRLVKEKVLNEKSIRIRSDKVNGTTYFDKKEISKNYFKRSLGISDRKKEIIFKK